ncbi:MAG: S9 family peptidase [Micropepsaceae bacterium]
MNRPLPTYAQLLLLSLSVIALACSAVAGDLIPRKILFGNPERSAPYISPDGKWLAYTAARDGVMNIWVAPVSDLAAARPVTREKSRPIIEFKWASNSTHVLYYQDHDGDENYHLYAVDLGGGRIRDLTPYKSVRAQIIAQSYARPDEVLVGLNNRDSRWHDAWLVNVVTGEATLVQKNDGFADFVADMDLNIRLGSKPLPDGGSSYFSWTAGTWKPFIRVSGDDSLNTQSLFFHISGKKVFFIDSRRRDKSALSSIDATSGKTSILSQSSKSDLTYVLKDPATNMPLAAAFEYDRMEWRAIDRKIQTDLDTLAKSVNGYWFPLSQTRDNRLWTIWIDNPGKPIRFGLYDRSDHSLKQLYTARPNLEGAPLPTTAPFTIRARDGLKLVSYLTLPRNVPVRTDGKPVTPVPMVLMVHGGPWARDSLAYNPYSAWLANRGYAVLAVNFRGSTGFGKAFVNAGDKEWGGKMHDDLIDAVNWSVQEGIAIRDRIAIYGASYGGYASLVGLTRTPDRFACAVDIVGPSNLMTMLSNVPAYWQSFLDNFKRRLGDPSTPAGRKFLQSRSPLFQARRIQRPLLIGQGANDPRVTQKESDQIVSAMKRKNLPVTYVLYSDEGHGFARAQNRLSFNAITEAFLAQCLAGRAEPVGTDFEGSSVSVPVGKEHIEGLGEALQQP